MTVSAPTQPVICRHIMPKCSKYNTCNANWTPVCPYNSKTVAVGQDAVKVNQSTVVHSVRRQRQTLVHLIRWSSSSTWNLQRVYVLLEMRIHWSSSDDCITSPKRASLNDYRYLGTSHVTSPKGVFPTTTATLAHHTLPRRRECSQRLHLPWRRRGPASHMLYLKKNAETDINWQYAKLE